MKKILLLIPILALCACSNSTPPVPAPEPVTSGGDSTNAVPTPTVGQTIATDVTTVLNNPLVDQAAGFAAGEAIIQLANKSNPTGTAIDIYQSSSFALSLDTGAPITNDQITGLGAAYKISEDSPQYNTILTGVTNAVNAYIQSKTASGANAAQIKATIANFIEGMQLAASMSGGGPAPAASTTPAATTYFRTTPNGLRPPFGSLQPESAYDLSVAKD